MLTNCIHVAAASDGGVTPVVILAFWFAAGLVALAAWWNRRKREGARIAAVAGGTLRRDGAVEVKRPGYEALLVTGLWPTFSMKAARPFEGRLRVVSNAGGEPGLFAGARLPTGDREFDGLYVATGAPPAIAERVLTPDVRASIRRIGRQGDVLFNLHPQWFRLSAPCAAGSMMEAGLRIADALAGAIDDGVLTILDPETTRGECQVCGTEFSGTVVACAKCATLHHRDCWEYLGACSIYGCLSREFRSA